MPVELTFLRTLNKRCMGGDSPCMIPNPALGSDCEAPDAPHNTLQPAPQLLRVNGLGKIIRGSGTHAAHGFGQRRVVSDQKQLDNAAQPAFLQKSQTVIAEHVAVHQRNIRSVAQHGRSCLVQGADDIERESGFAERIGQTDDRVRILADE